MHNNVIRVWRARHLGVLSGEEALFEAAVHGEGDEGQQPPVLQQSERGQKGVTERLPVPTKLAGLLPVDVVQKHCHDEHGQQAHACHTTQDIVRFIIFRFFRDSLTLKMWQLKSTFQFIQKLRYYILKFHHHFDTNLLLPYCLF